MPAPIHVIAITPIALVSAVQSVTGMLCAASLYTETDPTPRTETHRSRSGPVTASQRAQLDAAKDVDGNIIATNIDPSFVGVAFKDWPKDQPSPYPGMLADMGLTTSSTV
jgi:hypothetical protein